MAQLFHIHPDNPQLRLINQARELIRKGGVIVYPTDSSYALACQLEDKKALDRIRRIRNLDDRHNFTLVCKDLAQISNYTKIGNDAYRMIKSMTPGPFTFILKGTREVPRRLLHPSRKSIGVRIPDNVIAQALLTALDAPLFSTTLILPGENESPFDPEDIRDRLQKEVDLIIDGGYIIYEPTTIILLSEGAPEVVRKGKGQAPALV